MADNIVNSLFGLSPLEEYRKQQVQQDRAFAKDISQYGVNPQQQLGLMIGANLGSGLARGLGGMFGLEDPTLKRLSGLEGVLQETQQELGQNMADPTKLYPALYDKLNSRGFGREAAMVAMQGQDAINNWNLNKAKISQEEAQAGKYKAETKAKEQETQQDIDAQKAIAKFTSANNRRPTMDETIQILGQFLPPAKLADVIGKIGNTGVPSTDKLAAQALQILDDPTASQEMKQRATDTLNRVQQLKNVPPGFERMPDGSVRPVIGGPQDIKEKEKNLKSYGALKSRLEDLNAFETALAQAKSLASPKTTGLVGKGLALIPGEPAYDLASTLETITSGLAFDKLQQMRANSPTGGALGNVSNQELSSLKAAIANLKQSQSYEQFIKNLENVQTRYAKIKAAAEQDLNMLEQTKPSGPSPSNQFVVGRTYTDAKGNKAVYQADGSWKEIK